MVSSLPKDAKNPGTYNKEINKAKPTRPSGGKPSTKESVANAAGSTQILKIDENYEQEVKSIPNKVVAVSPKASAPSRFTNKIQEVVTNFMPKELQPELKKYMSMSDDEVAEIFSNFLLGQNKLDSELLDLKMKYDVLKTKVNEGTDEYVKNSLELEETKGKLEESKKTITKIKQIVIDGSTEITKLYNSSGEGSDLEAYIENIEVLFNQMKTVVNLSEEEIKNIAETEEKINAVEISTDNQMRVDKKTEAPSLEIDALEKLLTSMSLQSADAQNLRGNLDLQLEKSGDKATSEFFTNVSMILNRLSDYVKNMKSIKKELNKLLPLLQDEILSRKICGLSEKQLRSFEIISGLTISDQKKKIEQHLQKHAYIESDLLDLLIRYAQSHMIYITLIQKISVSIACEKMNSEDIKKIQEISILLSSLGLDFKAIKIPEIHYKVLNSLFKIIRDEVSNCYEKFRGYRRAYMEKKTPNVERLKRTLEKEKLEFSCIEIKWNIIASHLNEMMTTMQKNVKLGEYPEKIPDPVMGRYAYVRHIEVAEVKGEFTSFEEAHSEQETLTIMLNKDYETFWRDIGLVKFELNRLIDALEVQKGSFLSESVFSTKQKARSWNYFGSLSENEIAVEKMFPIPKSNE